MSWYLTITADAGQESVGVAPLLVEFLAKLPELRQTGPASFGPAPGEPWVAVILAKTGPTGGYATDGSLPPSIDIVELVCSDSEYGTGWYDSLAARIAAFLGWVAVEEDENRQVWPPP